MQYLFTTPTQLQLDFTKSVCNYLLSSEPNIQFVLGCFKYENGTFPMKFLGRFVKARAHHSINWTAQLVYNLKACGTFKRIN